MCCSLSTSGWRLDGRDGMLWLSVDWAAVLSRLDEARLRRRV